MEFSNGRRESLRPQHALFLKLRAAAAIGCVLAGAMPSWAMGQQAAPQNQANTTDPALQGLPPEPAPNYTQPLFMRATNRDFSKARNYWPNPLEPYRTTTVAAPNFLNSPSLDNLVKDGKIYLSLSDAVLLALENNFDIAIQRMNLDIADTDLLRARAGSTLLGVNSGTVTGTVGGATSNVSSVGGGPGGTSVASGGAGTGQGGLSLSTNGGGPAPENMDPSLTGLIELQRQVTPELSPLFVGTTHLNTNLNQYNFSYNQGFITGTALQVSFNNSYTTSNSIYNVYSPALQSTFNMQLTQHLLQGFGWGINGRFIVQAKNNRRISDSAFRAQLLYTINQVENIYWGLVSAYEDVQAKQRALAQSTQLASDNRKQLEIGTLAPLDVVNADSQVASDKQALISSQSTLEYQQLVMKQAISRNLDDPRLANAPVIPTDRVSLLETPEERMSVEDLVRQADANSPSIEQAVLAIKNDEITLKGVKNGLLPTLDVFGFYGAQAVGGAISPYCNSAIFGASTGSDFCTSLPTAGYGTVFSNLFNSSGPNKGVGFNLTVPIRNRTAQAEQARSMLEYRQAQMRLQQLYVQTRMNVTNQQYALTNDRAAVQAAQAAREFAFQSLDSEQKKYRLGASTTANVLQQERNLATAENNVISATAKYATDRSGLAQTLANTLDRYGINIAEAATGTVTQKPVVPGLEPAKQLPDVVVPGQQQNLQQQQQQPVPQPQNLPQPQPLPQQPTQPQQPQ